MLKPMLSLEAMIRLHVSYGMYLSPNKEQMIYFSNRSGRFELWQLELATLQSTQISSGQLPATPRTNIVWQKDNITIILGIDNAGDEQHNLWTCNTKTSEWQQLSDNRKSQEIPQKISPDGKTLFFSSTQSGQAQIYAMNLETKTWQQLTDFEAPAFLTAISSDGKFLTFDSNQSTSKRNLDGYIIHTNGSHLEKIWSLKDGAFDRIGDIHPNNTQLAVASDSSFEHRIGLYDLGSRSTTWLSAEQIGTAEYIGKYSPNGTWLLALRDYQAAMQPILYNTSTFEPRVFNIPKGVAYGGEWVSESKVLIAMQTPTRREEFVLYDLETDTYQTVLPADYGNLEPSAFVQPEMIQYPSFDGQMVSAFLYKPRNASPEQQFPAIMDIHGGPTAQFRYTFDPDAQVLADQGYVVLQPNIRGSTGYGVAWRDANLFDWGGKDLEDVAHGAKYLQNQDFVDSNRIAITGGSFGGYMTYMASTKHPNLFKVAIPEIGITDLEQLYKDNLERLPALAYYFRSLMGDPDTNQALWRERSAIHYAHQLSAKMLILHGRNDPRCPLNQAENFVTKLLENGKLQGQDFEIMIFDDGHGTADINAKLRNATAKLEYLSKWL
jgi:dipeptidyl aminopeptidase/acylaminoacyl peptidase